MADGLTKRQIAGHCRVGESTEASVVTIVVWRKLSGDLFVFAKRLRYFEDGGEENATLGPPGLAQLSENVLGENLMELLMNHKIGMILHDPDQSPLGADEMLGPVRSHYLDAAVRALLACHLPLELAFHIISLADCTLPYKNAALEYHQSPQYTPIFLLFPTTEKELMDTSIIIQDSLLDCTHEEVKPIKLIPMTCHGILSRRDLLSFWKDHLHHDPNSATTWTPLKFLLSPIEDINSAQFGAVCGCCLSPAIIRRATFHSIMKFKFSDLDWYDSVNLSDVWKKQGIEAVESMYHPDQPFYPNPPKWLSVCQWDDSYKAIPVFYLTNQLKSDEDNIIRAELVAKDGADNEFEWRKEACYVPWRGDHDATLEDIWDIFWKFWGHEARNVICPCFFCIDRQSAMDQTVLLICPDWYLYETDGAESRATELLANIPGSGMRGFRYTRVHGRNAHINKINIDSYCLSIEDTGGHFGVKRFRRPDFPALGILPGDEAEVKKVDRERR